MPGPVEIAKSDALTLIEYDRMGIMVVRDAPGLDEVVVADEWHRDMVARWSGRIAWMNVLDRGEGTAQASDADARMLQHINAMLRRSDERGHGLANVLVGDSLVHSTFRSILRLGLVMARARYPNQVFGEVDDALGWLVQRLPPDSSITYRGLKAIMNNELNTPVRMAG